MKNTLRTLTLAAAAAGLSSFGAHAATTADVIFVVDESGSMGGEHAWIATMVGQLEAELVAAGVTGNRYGLVGYGDGAHSGVGSNPHNTTHLMGGSQWGTSGQLATAAGTLVAGGSTEDGYEAIAYALNAANYTFRANAAVNIILITDEDRDVAGGPGYAATLALLTGANATLNVVVNNPFTAGGSAAVGVSGVGAGSEGYIPDGMGGYTTGTPGVVGDGSGNTENDYPPLAFATGGAAWDLNLLRNSATSASFTDAFVDIKVDEIVSTPTPASGSTLAFLFGSVVLLGATRRKFAKAA